MISRSLSGVGLFGDASIAGHIVNLAAGRPVQLKRVVACAERGQTGAVWQNKPNGLARHLAERSQPSKSRYPVSGRHLSHRQLIQFSKGLRKQGEVDHSRGEPAPP
jgi:hypothetical protein